MARNKLEQEVTVEQVEVEVTGSNVTDEELQHQETLEENTRKYFLEQASILGLNVPKNIPTEKLKETVGRALRSNKERTAKDRKLSEIAAEQFEDMRALERVRIHNLNPAKQGWTGEIFTVGNDVIPTITRFIPYNTETGIWHIERIFIPFLRSRKFQVMATKTGSDKKGYGVDVTKNRLMPEFSLEILPPLTEEELEEIAERQNVTGTD